MTDGQALGTLCVIDKVPRTLSPEQLEALRALSRQAQAQLELRRNLKRLGQSLAARDRAEAEKDRTLQELRAALANIRTLEGLLPVCLSCKKIQDQRGIWQPFEYYVRTHSEAKVAHRICPDCSLHPPLNRPVGHSTHKILAVQMTTRGNAEMQERADIVSLI